MKKYVIAALLVLAMCMTALAGCMKFLEKDVQITLDSGGENLGCYSVNNFNNAIVPRPEVPEKFEGMTFIGWTAQENWEELEAKQINVSANKELIRYDDVKDYVKKGSITLYAAFVKVDLVIAWYDRHTSGTDSGLNEENMGAFKDNMYAHLKSEGYTPENMYIDIRSYSGAVGASCEKIIKDADVDIMVGWGNNLDTDGGITCVEKQGSIAIGSTSRYAASLNEKPLTNLIFTWIKDTYKAKAENPDYKEEDTTGKIKLVIGWYSKEGTSGLNKQMITAFETALKEYLTAQGYNLDGYAILIRDLGNGNVASVQDIVTAKKDFDILLGMKAISLDGIEIKGEQKDVVMGAKTDRRIHLLSDSEIAKFVFEWLKTDDARNLFKV